MIELMPKPTDPLAGKNGGQTGQGRCPRVLLAGKLTGMASPGGGEAQLQALLAHLPQTGVEARLWRPWEDRLDETDCLHLLGSEPEHLGVVEAAHRVGRPVLLSTIAWFDLADCWREPWPMTRRVIACGKFMARAACPRLRSWRRDLYHCVDLLLPNSHAEADQLVRYFGVSAKKIHVVPNGAEPRFATGDPRPFIEAVGLRHFVLCPGRIEPRKNQLGLIRALRGCGLPIVILGDAVPGHEKYLATCRASADEDVRFMGRIERDDPLLASAYAACRCLALVSWYETPGLVALEAAMSGAPLVLPKGGCAREYFAGHASYVAPNDEHEIRREVLRAFERGRSLSLASLVRKQFSWQAVARATKEAYEKVL